MSVISLSTRCLRHVWRAVGLIVAIVAERAWGPARTLLAAIRDMNFPSDAPAPVAGHGAGG